MARSQVDPQQSRGGHVEWGERPEATPAFAPALPQLGIAGRGIYIHCSERAPEHAMTAIEHHGFWYSIDATDADTKLVFRVLTALMSVQLADDSDRDRALPTLTVPVSR